MRCGHEYLRRLETFFTVTCCLRKFCPISQVIDLRRLNCISSRYVTCRWIHLRAVSRYATFQQPWRHRSHQIEVLQPPSSGIQGLPTGAPASPRCCVRRRNIQDGDSCRIYFQGNVIEKPHQVNARGMRSEKQLCSPNTFSRCPVVVTTGKLMLVARHGRDV